MKAVKRYDPERGVRLVSFAVHWIKAEIHEFILRNWRLVKIATTKAQRKLFFNLRSMKPVLDTMNPGRGQRGLPGNWASRRRKWWKWRPASVDEIFHLSRCREDDDEAFSPIAYLTDGSEPPARAGSRTNQAFAGRRTGAAPCPAWMRAAAALSRRAG